MSRDFILKMRTDEGSWASMADAGLLAGEELEWGEVGASSAGFRQAGDVKLFRTGAIGVGDRLLVKQRLSSTREVFPALLEIIEIDSDSVEAVWVPTYRVLEVFENAPLLATLKRTDERVAALPQFTKNAAGTMQRAFLEIDHASMEHLLSLLRPPFAPRLPQSAFTVNDPIVEEDSAVEAIAVEIAVRYEEGERSAEVQSHEQENLGYDLVSTTKAGETRYIEVKGRARSGVVQLSPNEFGRAVELRESYWLYVVFGCTSNSPELFRIQNPATRLEAEWQQVIRYQVGPAAIISAASPEVPDDHPRA